MRERIGGLFTAAVLIAAVFFVLTAAPPPPEKPKGAAPAQQAEYAGNISTKKFHRKGCKYFHCRNCTAKFKTRQEALDAGFDPCGICDP